MKKSRLNGRFGLPLLIGVSVLAVITVCWGATICITDVSGGATIKGTQNGSGSAGSFSSTNGARSASATLADGAGRAGLLTSNTAGDDAFSVTQTGAGRAGDFNINPAMGVTNGNVALLGQTSGTGNGSIGVEGYAAPTASATVYGGYFQVGSQASSSSSALYAVNAGAGAAGYFTSPTGSTSTADTLYAETWSPNAHAGDFRILSATGSDDALYALTMSPTGRAATFGGTIYVSGDVHVTGQVDKAACMFKIDDPIDPLHKYLVHTSVESPDMLNTYTGNVTTDASGLTTVSLPGYFQSENRDPRYQLTVIGQFAQAIVQSEEANNSFVIQTSGPNVKVSWAVTGIRQDPYANAHRTIAEPDKGLNEVGKYLHPREWGQPDTAGIDYAVTHPTPVASGTPVPSPATAARRAVQSGAGPVRHQGRVVMPPR